MSIRSDDDRSNGMDGKNEPEDREFWFGFHKWRASWGRPPVITLIGTWIFGVMLLLMPIMSAVMIARSALVGPRDGFQAVYLAGLVLFGGMIVMAIWWLWRTTRTYYLLTDCEYVDEPEHSNIGDTVDDSPTEVDERDADLTDNESTD